jgi:deoxyribose-phosphate aldolase
MPPRAAELAKAIESTLLRANATASDVAALCSDALERHFAAVAVLPVHVRAAAEALRGTDVKVVALISFPFGADVPDVKLAASEAAADSGAAEVEVVMGMATFLGGDLPAVRDELRAIVRTFGLRGGRSVAVRGVVETAYLDDNRIRLAAKVMTAAGVDAVVTSTGLAPRGASPLDVELLRGELDPRIGIKAVGGVRTVEEAADLLAAGAGRIGTSSAASLHDRALGRP